MQVDVRPLRDGELRLYLEIIERSVRGLAASHYSQDDIEGWVVALSEENLRRLTLNAEGETRLLAEVDGQPSGIGSLILKDSELCAVYVSPEFARLGCRSAIVHEIERIATDNGLTRLTLSASLNAEGFYAGHGYEVIGRTDVVLYGFRPLWTT